jgi:hypothetical protein
MVHQKNHQQPLGTTDRSVNAQQHPRYYQDKQHSWTKILPLAHTETETPYAKNKYSYNRQLTCPSNQSQIMKVGSLCNVENAAHTDMAVCEDSIA